MIPLMKKNYICKILRCGFTQRVKCSKSSSPNGTFEMQNQSFTLKKDEALF
jgi:hypothetical protein